MKNFKLSFLAKALIVLALLAVAVTAIASCGDCIVHSWDAGQVTVAATCTTNGTKLLTCNECGTTKEETIAPTHTFTETVKAASCTEGGVITRLCTSCGFSMPKAIAKLPHSYQVTKTSATCTMDGTAVYTCSVCEDSYTEITQRALGHTTTGATWTAVDECVSGCQYKAYEKAQCTACQADVFRGETSYEKHTFSVAISTAATCQTEGTKTFTCKNCNAVTTESFTDETAHNWDNGTVSASTAGITNYSCTNEGCAQTKSVFSLKTEVAAVIPSEALKSAGEVELKEASVKLDEKILEQLGDADVTISAGKLESDELNGILDKLGENSNKLVGTNVFDFTLSKGDEGISKFDGKITVTVPFTLEDGMDPDNIAVWYIKEDGSFDTLPAKYTVVNGEGFAVFETDHFSYYTVVRMTPAERCAVYGHKFVETVTPAKCGVEGFTSTICKMCKKVEPIKDITPALVHNYVATVTPSTCSSKGYTQNKCSLCADTYVSAYTEKAAHTYVQTVVDPTCKSMGYTLNKCSACSYSYTENETSPIAHSFASGACTMCGKSEEFSGNTYLSLVNSLSTANSYLLSIDNFSVFVKNGDMDIEYAINNLKAYVKISEDGFLEGHGISDATQKITSKGEVMSEAATVAKVVFANKMMYFYQNVPMLNGAEEAPSDTPSSYTAAARGNGVTFEVSDDVTEETKIIVSGNNITQIGATVGDHFVVQVNPGIDFSPIYSTNQYYQYDMIVGPTVNYYQYVGISNLVGVYSQEFLLDEMKDEMEYDEFSSFLTEELKEQLLSIWTSMQNKKDSELNRLLGRLIETIFVKTAANNVYTYTFNPTFTKVLYSNIKSKNINELVDIMLGAGSYESLLSFINSAFDKTVPQLKEDLKNDLAKSGISLETVLAIVESITGQKLDDMINQFGEAKLYEILNVQMGGEQTVEQYQAMVAGYDEMIKSTTVYSFIESYVEMAEGQLPEGMTIDSLIDEAITLLSKASFQFSTTKEGDFISSSAKFDNVEYTYEIDTNNSYNIKINGTISFAINSQDSSDVSDVIIKGETIADALEITEPVDLEYYTLFASQGKTYLWSKIKQWYSISDLYLEYRTTYEIVDELGADTYNGVNATKLSVMIENLYMFTERDGIAGTEDCLGWYRVEADLRRVAAPVEATLWVDADGNVLGFDVASIDDFYLDYANVNLYYAPTTKEYKTFSAHNFQLVRTVDPVGCEYGYNEYRCSACGLTFKQTFGEGHLYSETELVLVDGATSCEDGVKVTNICSKCGERSGSYTSYYHATRRNKIVIECDSECGDVWIYYYECACGYKSMQYSEMVSDHIFDRSDDYSSDSIKYVCSVNDCGLSYTYSYNEDHKIVDGKCYRYVTRIFNFGGKDYKFEEKWESHDEEYFSETNEVTGITTTKWTCRLCGKVTSHSENKYDQYGRTVYYYDVLGKYGYRRAYTGCYYVQTSFEMKDGQEVVTGTSSDTNHYSWSTSYILYPTCTQYGIRTYECSICHENDGYYYVSPESYWWWGSSDTHNWYWDYDKDAYVCNQCGTESALGADGLITLEDMVELGSFKVGYFNRLEFMMDSEVNIEIVFNYDEDGAGIPVKNPENYYNNEDTTPFDDNGSKYIRNSGIVTVDLEALKALITEDVETVSLVFQVLDKSRTQTDENGNPLEFWMAHALTFELSELFPAD